MKCTLQALVFDSYYDEYRGVICNICIKPRSRLKVDDDILFMQTGGKYKVYECGVKNPKEVKKNELVCGEVGWVAATVKSSSRYSCWGYHRND